MPRIVLKVLYAFHDLIQEWLYFVGITIIINILQIKMLMPR